MKENALFVMDYVGVSGKSKRRRQRRDDYGGWGGVLYAAKKRQDQLLFLFTLDATADSLSADSPI